MNSIAVALLLAGSTHMAVSGERPADHGQRVTPLILRRSLNNYSRATSAAAVAGRKLKAAAPAPPTPLGRARGRRRAGGADSPTARSALADKILPTAKAGTARAVAKARVTAPKKNGPEATSRALPVAPSGKGRRTSAAPPMMSSPFPSGLTLPIVKGQTRRGQRHYDPTRSGNELLNTSRRYRDKKVAENFFLGEFTHSGDEIYDESRLDPRLVVCLQSIRNLVGEPVFVGSGYRSYWRNLDVYRKRGEKPTNSQHIAGRAADIKIGSMTGIQIAKMAVNACGPNVAVGIGPHFAHIDVRGTFGVWLYKDVPRRQLTELIRHHDAFLMAQRGRVRRLRRGGRTRRV